ncbi:gamma-tubulin complex component [Plakobranchus ocellatus]|uniref:Gamma-tubulin complex component n=1 Tax=Plakobranchus ocellatus TaxID=259542 RepID=A0AAV4A8J4_9GAST|nr:gamma-tubulin complex component [Plakobranchus ocellatus]
MAKANKREAAIQRDVKKLITSVTGFEERDENFSRCLQYVDSNIKYHRYLSPDSHKIHRAIDGLCEKFEIHSQGQKAKDLRDLTVTFLDQPGLDGKDTGKTDVHYAMLSLLVNLAVAPTQVDFSRKQPEPTAEELDDFDWKAYLLDGEDLNFLSHASSESDEGESLDDSGDSDGDQRKADNDQKLVGKIDGDQPESEKPGDMAPASGTLSTARSEGSFRSQPAQNVEDEYSQMEKILVAEYWRGKSSEEAVGGSHAACQMSRDWKSYQQRLNPFQTFPNQVVVTEMQVIRETLWMLSGVTELFVFQHNGKEFYLNPDVYVMHLTPESLQNSLIPLMLRAQQAHFLDTFVADIVSQRCNWSSSDSNLEQSTNQDRGHLANRTVPQTYMAFASCISEFLTEFRAAIVRVEKRVIKQEETILLTSIASDLRTWLQKVEAVHRVVMHGVAPVSASPLQHGDRSITKATAAAADGRDGDDVFSDSSSGGGNNCSRATLLLDTLYDSVFESDLMAQGDSAEMASLMLRMLIKSSQPLLQIISDWINNGTLADTAAEFVLHRNKDIKSLDETFWEKAFMPSVQTSASSAELSTSALKADTKGSSNQGSSSRHSQGSHVTSEGSISGYTDLHSAEVIVGAGPKLLRPILKEAILTGKSMEMLENLGRMREALNINSNIFERPPSLYELFVKDLQEVLSSKKGTEESEEVDRRSSGARAPDQLSPGSAVEKISEKRMTATQVRKDPTIERQLNLPGLKDTLLNINFAALFSYPKSTTGSKREEPQCPRNAQCNLQPLLKLCGSCLYPHISLRYRTVCSKLVQILKEEYDLMGCIHAMQRYYLMSAGEVMYDFYTAVFSKIESREFWQDCSLLEMNLHEAVESLFPDDAARLSVEIVSTSSRSHQKSAINATDCIHLKYSVPWPVDVVISRRCEDRYNDVFTFILQIKRAKFTLDQLRFDDLSREQSVLLPANELFPGESETFTRRSRIHQFHLLRFRLLYFVNSLHNYIMTQILHSTELEFECQLDAAVDLDQIIHIHSQYVDAIHERCLLHQRLTVLREAVVRVLNLSLTFGTRWRQGVDFTSGEAIQEIDTELTRCIHFLSSFLQMVIKRGSYPHLESLAFALVSSLQFKVATGDKIS